MLHLKTDNYTTIKNKHELYQSYIKNAYFINNSLTENILQLTCNVNFDQYIFDIRLRCCIIYFNKSCRNKTNFDLKMCEIPISILIAIKTNNVTYLILKSHFCSYAIKLGNTVLQC